MGEMDKNIVSLFFIALIVFIVFYSLRTKSKFSHDHPILKQVSLNFSKLDPEYSKIPIQMGDSAYTENKEIITLCLKDPDTKKYYDMNTIMYVALHELAHVNSKTHGHNSEFKKNFAILLRDASRKKIYDPRKDIPMTYCGVGPHD